MKRFDLWFPVKPRWITQPFGVTKMVDYYKANGINIIGHNGVDFLTTRGQEVRASHDGQVTFAGLDGAGGWGVVIRTNEPFEYEEKEVFFKTIYWHLLPNIPVKGGQQVRAGDVIGFADSTGLSTGDHLHFGLKPQAQGENDWTWSNIEQNNGYLGAISPDRYWNGLYAEQISVFEKIIELLKKVVELLKERNRLVP